VGVLKEFGKKIDEDFAGGAIGLWIKEKRSEREFRDLSSNLSRYIVHHQSNDRNLVSELCDRYGSDKGEVRSSGHPYAWPSHTYADFYSRLFSHCRHDVTKVFECGLGTNNPDLPSSMGVEGKPGASLRVWREFFPNAIIYGADIDRDVLFEEDRIKTFYIDQLDPNSVEAFWKNVGVDDFDLIVDDGLHTFDAGSCLFKNSAKYLSDNGVYVIEDVVLSDLIRYKKFFGATDFVVDYVTMFRPNIELDDRSHIRRLDNNNMVVIRKS
jgi:hypothetical protein